MIKNMYREQKVKTRGMYVLAYFANAVPPLFFNAPPLGMGVMERTIHRPRVCWKIRRNLWQMFRKIYREQKVKTIRIYVLSSFSKGFPLFFNGTTPSGMEIIESNTQRAKMHLSILHLYALKTSAASRSSPNLCIPAQLNAKFDHKLSMRLPHNLAVVTSITHGCWFTRKCRVAKSC